MYTKIKFGFLCCLFSYFQCFSSIFCHDIRIKPHLALLFPFISLLLCVRIYDQRKEMGILRERRKIFWQKCLVWWYRVLCVKGVRNRRDFHVSSWVGLELTLNYLLLSLITTTLLHSKEMKEGKDIGFAFSNVRDEYSNIGHVCVAWWITTCRLYAKFSPTMSCPMEILSIWVEQRRNTLQLNLANDRCEAATIATIWLSKSSHL